MKDLEVTIAKEKIQDSHFELAGKDILPRKYKERYITPSKLVAIWFAMAIEITLFIQSAELYPALPVWQIVLSCALGHTLLCVVMWFTQDIGIKYGIPFAVSLRPSFGYVGAFIPTYLRALPAMFWFGFQTWIGATAINSITTVVWSYDNLSLWIIVLGIVQIVHTTLGIKAVTRLSILSSPLLIIVGIYMLYLMFTRYNINFWGLWSMGGEGGKYSFSLATMAYIGGWATLALSIMDITRDCKITQEEVGNWWLSTRKFMIAQWVGLVPAVVFYGFIGVVGMITTGEYNPVLILVEVVGNENLFFMILSLLFVLLATWSTNDTANLFPPAYALASTWPSKINFAKGVIIAGLAGLAMRPWTAADYIIEVLVIFGTILAPVTGIVICDYFVLRKRTINLNELYKNNGQYKYWNNINPAAIAALAIGVIISIPFWDYVFIVGLLGGGISYYILMKYWIINIYPQPEISFSKSRGGFGHANQDYKS